ncbi:unnamed protein product, partial [Ectocarpus sp. 13 AM-2016]
MRSLLACLAVSSSPAALLLPQLSFSETRSQRKPSQARGAMVSLAWLSPLFLLFQLGRGAEDHNKRNMSTTMHLGIVGKVRVAWFVG